MTSKLLLALGIALGAVAGTGFGVHARPKTPDRVLHVTHATSEITIDGELEDPAWLGATRTGGFTVGGAPARPYSDARFTWRDDMLYVVLYAADEDIRIDRARHDDPLWGADAFEITLTTPDGTERTIAISAGGVVTDAQRVRGGTLDTRWESGAKVALDRDGTPNDPSDDDEEWVVEAAVPRAAVPEGSTISVRRCDVIRGGVKSCATWPERGAARLAYDP